ncbi:hypothetical protein LUZ60_005543 [Juncus effusus]|nr:hypothetical protein LUZ60_005543 [Juncus effusus]
MALIQLAFRSSLPPNYFRGDVVPSKRSNLLPTSLLPRSQTIPIKEWNLGRRKEGKGRMILVRANNKGFNFDMNFNSRNGNRGGGGGGNGRIIGNLVVAAGLTYLSVTGQLRWVLDAIVSVSILAVLLPIVGVAAFFYFASQNILQSSCPNCGNEFQIFKSSLSDAQLCPFCTQPFSVEDGKFVREPTIFSSEKFAQTFSSKDRATNAASATIVDVEAEVKDAEFD